MIKTLFIYLMGMICLCMSILQCDSEFITVDEFSRIQLEIVDTPPVSLIENVFIHIREVTIHKAGEGWITLGTPDSVFDLLTLVNGSTEVVADTVISPGKYSQLRLILGELNSVVKDSVSYPLFIPSGKQSGIKFNLDMTLGEGEVLKLCVDFDIARSLKFKKNSMSYMMKPTYKVFPKR